MKILITGASGFIGSELCRQLENNKYTVIKLSRNPDQSKNTFFWNPDLEQIDSKALENIDHVIHLAGESIAALRWSPTKKTKILTSRIKGTEFLVKKLLELKNKPKTLLSASAIGYYGEGGEQIITEQTKTFKPDFLSEVCTKWEAASRKAESVNIKVINLRFGVVLDPSGGMLKSIVPIFKLGLGGKLGTGKQYLSWISRTDLVNAIIFTLDSNLSGPINFTSPNPITNLEFTKLLANRLNRPAFFNVPSLLLKLLAGEFAETTLLRSQRVIPEKLLKAGFKFKHLDYTNFLQSLQL